VNGAMADWFNFATPMPAPALTTLRLATPRMCFSKENRSAEHGQEQRDAPEVPHRLRSLLAPEHRGGGRTEALARTKINVGCDVPFRLI